MKKRVINYYLTLALLVSISFQLSFFGLDKIVYSLMKQVIFIIIGIIFIFNLSSIFKFGAKQVFIARLGILLVVQLFLVALLSLIRSEFFLPGVLDVVMVLSVILTFSVVKFEDSELQKISSVFLFLAAISSATILFGYEFNFQILDEYLPVPKNQLAPFYGVAFVIGVYNFKRQNGYFKLFHLMLLTVLGLGLLFIRGRAALVATFLCLMIFNLFFVRERRYRYIGLGLFIVAVYLLSSLLFDVFTANYDVNDVDSLSANRLGDYISAIDIILKNPFVGSALSVEVPYLPHNYLVYSLMNYGVLFGWPLLIIYLMIFIKCFRVIINNKNEIWQSGILLVVLMYIVSLLEYSYPYSPGSATMFGFIMFGQYLRRSIAQQEKNKIIRFG